MHASVSKQGTVVNSLSGNGYGSKSCKARVLECDECCGQYNVRAELIARLSISCHRCSSMHLDPRSLLDLTTLVAAFLSYSTKCDPMYDTIAIHYLPSSSGWVCDFMIPHKKYTGNTGPAHTASMVK